MLMQLDDGWWQEPYLRSDSLARWLLGGSERYLNARLIVEQLRYIPCLFLPTFFCFLFTHYTREKFASLQTIESQRPTRTS